METDPELTPEQRDKFQFVTDDNDRLSDPQPRQPVPPVRIRKVVDLLKDFAKTVEDKVTSDPVIKEETNKIIAEAIRPQGSDETDSGTSNEGIIFDLNVVCSHIQEVFKLLLDDSLKSDGQFLFMLFYASVCMLKRGIR